jgi:hypothetical protein
MTLGIIAVFIAILFSGMVLWEKIFVTFGLFCAIVLQIVGIIGSIQRLKAYMAAMEAYEKLNLNPTPTTYHG